MRAPDPPLAIAIVIGTTFGAQVAQKRFNGSHAFPVLVSSFILGGFLYAFNAANADFGAAMTWLVLIGALLLNGAPTMTALAGKVA